MNSFVSSSTVLKPTPEAGEAKSMRRIPLKPGFGPISESIPSPVYRTSGLSGPNEDAAVENVTRAEKILPSIVPPTSGSGLPFLSGDEKEIKVAGPRAVSNAALEQASNPVQPT